MVCTSCNTLCNVLSHSHVMIRGLVQFVGGGSIDIQGGCAKEISRGQHLWAKIVQFQVKCNILDVSFESHTTCLKLLLECYITGMNVLARKTVTVTASVQGNRSPNLNLPLAFRHRSIWNGIQALTEDHRSPPNVVSIQRNFHYIYLSPDKNFSN